MARICVHGLPEVQPGLLADFDVAALTSERQELVKALGALGIEALVIDLDEPGSLTTLTVAKEVCPRLAIVGATAGGDISRVVAAQRAGCKQITTKPIDHDDVSSALKHCLDEGAAEGVRELCIALIGACGGVGVTTLASHLALEISAMTESGVTLIDLDLELGSVARCFDASPPHSLFDLTQAGVLDRAVFERACFELPGNVRLLARPNLLTQAHSVDPETLGNVLRLARRVDPFVVLDLPRRLDGATGTAIESADRLLIVLQLTVPGLFNARRILDTLVEEGFSADRVEFVVNRFRRNTHACSFETLEKQLGKPAIGVVPNDYKAVSSATDSGHAIPERNPVRLALGELVTRLLGSQIQPTARPASTARRAWLGGLHF